MRIGFISPSLRPLEINWEHDYEMVKLGVPTIMGFLARAGHHDCEHWDFDAQVCDLLERDPRAFNLLAYFERDKVTGFINGTDDSLRAQSEKLLDTLEVSAKEIYGFSLSAVLDRIVNVQALVSMTACLAKILKERHPGCVVVIGGVGVSPDTKQLEVYRQALTDCPFFDYAYVGKSDEVVVQLFRDIARGNVRGLRGVLRRVPGADGKQRLDLGISTFGLDADLLTQKHGDPTQHHPAHTRPGAKAMRDGLREEGGAVEVTDEVPRFSAMETAPAADAASADADMTVLPAQVPVFDPKLVDRFRYTGAQIMRRFNFDKDLLLRYSRFEDNRIVVLPHIFVQGCNAPCGFCSYAYTKIQGEHVRDTVAGLKWLSEKYQCNAFHFLNTQINSVYEYCDAFCEELIRQDVNILWSDCANMRFMDEALLKKLRRAGAMRLVWGVEAPDDEMLKLVNKGINVARVEELLKVSHDFGIWNHVLLIAGMPHETKARQDRMMSFLERTAPMMDFYSISSFYLIASSPWGRTPEKFGIERISDVEDLLEKQAFNEMPGGRWGGDGLRWPEKKQQIVESTQRFYRVISAAKGQTRCVGGNIDLYLLMFLYSVLGHDKKAEIADLYVRTARANGHGSEVPEGTPALRVMLPIIVGRRNEGDQSSLAMVPLDLEVSQADDAGRYLFRTSRWGFRYRQPQLKQHGDFHGSGLDHAKDQVNAAIAQVGALVGPFARALDEKKSPESAQAMVSMLTANLARYPAWQNSGFMLEQKKRTPAERSLQWSGVQP